MNNESEKLSSIEEIADFLSVRGNPVADESNAHEVRYFARYPIDYRLFEGYNLSDDLVLLPDDDKVMSRSMWSAIYGNGELRNNQMSDLRIAVQQWANSIGGECRGEGMTVASGHKEVTFTVPERPVDGVILTLGPSNGPRARAEASYSKVMAVLTGGSWADIEKLTLT